MRDANGEHFWRILCTEGNSVKNGNIPTASLHFDLISTVLTWELYFETRIEINIFIILSKLLHIS